MESFRTAFRLIVMVAVLGVGYKAWQLYGPPTPQLKTIALRALELARSALEGEGATSGQNSTLIADPRPIAPAPVPVAPATGPTGQVKQAQALVPTNNTANMPSITPPALVPP